jgi:signal transduction histidine kinase
MGIRDWLRPPRHLLALFGIVTIVPAIVLLWLGWKVIEQDRDLDGPRVQARLDRATARVSADVARALDRLADDVPRWLTDPPVSLGQDAMVVRLDGHGVDGHAGAPLLFVPVMPSAVDPAPAIWERGEALEARADLAGAAQAFQSLTASPDRSVRAGALVRLAGNLRQLGRAEEALAAYRSLAALTDVRAMGEPADLLARIGACQSLASLNRAPELAADAASIVADLARGRWAIDRATYELRVDQLHAWTAVPDMSHAAALAGAIETAWRQRGAASPPSPATASRRTDGHSVLVMSRAEGDRQVVFAATEAYIAREWSQILRAESDTVSLQDAGGVTMVGQPPAAGQRSAVGPTGQPWTVRVTASTSPAELSAARWRRYLIGTGLAALVMLIPTGGYVVARAVQKELAVARLQADFVSAVSHEFRTPLTAIAHLTDRLQRDPGILEARRREYYAALARDTHRLGRFVETLLDFGRMESGAAVFRLEPADLAAVVGDVVTEFRGDAAAGQHRVELSPNGSLPPVRLDRASFGRALWNLLDNAAKYSAGESPIEVELGRDGNRAVVRVRDHGIGVPAAEHRQIFRKFVRGADQHHSGVRGTGVGLAMVDQIVRAHGGHVRLESEVGTGSVFSILLPVEDR